VEGAVEGDLIAEKSVLMKETAKIRGNIFAPTVSIVEGASFSGNIDMDGKKSGQTLGKHETVPTRMLKASSGAA
jgi:cytoskeletal protein CcmA (bactofilin family)